MLLKNHVYRQFGVRKYWIIDPESEIVSTMIFDEKLAEELPETYREYSFAEEIHVAVLDGCKLDMKEVSK